MNKKGLDEMQLYRKNRIGNQSFILLLYLLLLDTGLYGYGFRWISYPANIMIILMFCSAIYMVRLIRNNAYVGPSPNKENVTRKTLITVIVSVSIAILILVIIKSMPFGNQTQVNNMAAPILFITSITSILIVVATSIITKIQNKDQDD
jgi:uncharacterized membrane protein